MECIITIASVSEYRLLSYNLTLHPAAQFELANYLCGY